MMTIDNPLAQTYSAMRYSLSWDAYDLSGQRDSSPDMIFSTMQGPLLHPGHQRDQHPHEGGEQPGGGQREEESLVGRRPQLKRLLPAAEADRPESSL